MHINSGFRLVQREEGLGRGEAYELRGDAGGAGAQSRSHTGCCLPPHPSLYCRHWTGCDAAHMIWGASRRLKRQRQLRLERQSGKLLPLLQRRSHTFSHLVFGSTIVCNPNRSQGLSKWYQGVGARQWRPRALLARSFSLPLSLSCSLPLSASFAPRLLSQSLVFLFLWVTLCCARACSLIFAQMHASSYFYSLGTRWSAPK